MSTSVTAQEFRAAAMQVHHRLCNPESVATLLLAAAEQREQLDAAQSKLAEWHAKMLTEVPVTRTQQEAYEQQIATLTAERDAMRRRAEAAESDWQEVTAERDKTVAVLTHERDEARTLARQAVNGWACYAKRNAEHDEIAEIHAALDAPSRPA